MAGEEGVGNSGVLYALVSVHPLIWGILVAALIYVVVETLWAGQFIAGLCLSCQNGDPDVIAALAGAGTSVSTKFVKDSIEKGVETATGNKVKTPIFAIWDMFDIASQDTDEKQAKVAFDKYKSLIMMDNAPEGSTGDQVGEAMDRFLDFATNEDDDL